MYKLGKLVSKYIIILGSLLAASIKYIPIIFQSTINSIKIGGGDGLFVLYYVLGKYVLKNLPKDFKKLQEEPAEFSLGDFIQEPNYEQRLGFIHHVARAFLKISMDNDIQKERITPTLDQIQQWIIFSLKWPEASSWVKREGYCRDDGIGFEPNITSRKLQALEYLGKIYHNKKMWTDYVKSSLHLDVTTCK